MALPQFSTSDAKLGTMVIGDRYKGDHARHGGRADMERLLLLPLVH